MAGSSPLRQFQNVYIPRVGGTGIVTEIDRSNHRVKVEYTLHPGRASDNAGRDTDWFAAGEVTSFAWPVQDAVQAQARRDAVEALDFTTRQLDSLVFTITSSGWECVEAVKPFLRAAPDADPQVWVALVHAISLRFHMRLLSTQALAWTLRADAARRLREVLLLIIVPRQVRSFFAAPPEAVRCNAVVEQTLANTDRPFASRPRSQKDRLASLADQLIEDIGVIAGSCAAKPAAEDDARPMSAELRAGLAELTGEPRLRALKSLVRGASSGLENCLHHGMAIPTVVQQANAALRGASNGPIAH